MKKNKTMWLVALSLAIVAFLISFLGPFQKAENMLSDALYSRLSVPEKDIFLICIDEETLTEYGKVETWSRGKTAELLVFLFEEEANSPAVVGIDILFTGEEDSEGSNALKEAEKKYADAPIVLASNAVIRGVVEEENNRKVYNPNHVEMVEKPYVQEAWQSGFANAFLSEDGTNRYSKAALTCDGTKEESFAYLIAKEYGSKSGRALYEPETDAAGFFRFFYCAKTKEYSHVSLKNVLEGKIPKSEFAGKVVLVGPYAAGMQDNYTATHDIGSLFGVEVHANLIQAFLQNNFAKETKKLTYALILAGVVFVVSLLSNRKRIAFAIAIPVLAEGAHLLLGKFLAGKGLLIPQIYALFVFVLMLAILIIQKYVAEAKKRRELKKIFSKYMEPRVVESLSKDGSLQVNLGGESKDVSVLFVDIRGFTSMSEKLTPEEVVGILNEYLGLVTDCIFKHGGMLDKFIGDAAMAIFNAPVPQKDYYYESVAAAIDIAKGSQELSKRLQEKFGRTISYGIGVNCGPAVIGNIGCDFRMDYTAIGDTVNTSARLEANAGKGEILISDILKEKLDERILLESAGQMQFKGKEKPTDVYRVLGFRNEPEK